jgi:diaminopimelate epimerase
VKSKANVKIQEFHDSPSLFQCFPENHIGMTEPHVVIPFVKANACGNDFLIVDGTFAPADISAVTRRLCDRHSGVGADGVEWLFPADDADIEARLINSDGSEAEISGNGTRCVAAYLCSHAERNQVVVRTGAGPKLCRLTSHRASAYEFETAMGEPKVESEITLRVGSREVPGVPVSMGNPHFVIFVKEFENGWQSQAAELQQHPHFTQGVNVEFVLARDHQNIDVRFFERGAGETQSSGTGSCAAAVAAITAKKAESPLHVHAPGGTQTVRWDQQVHLRGVAELVCRGEFFI